MHPFNLKSPLEVHFSTISRQFRNPASLSGVTPLFARGRSWMIGELDRLKSGICPVSELPAERSAMGCWTHQAQPILSGIS